MVAVRCPHELDPLMRKGRRPVGAGRRAPVDPSGADGAADPQSAPRPPTRLFRRVGIDLDGKATDERPAVASGALMD